jgi:deoxyribonuclease-4
MIRVGPSGSGGKGYVEGVRAAAAKGLGCLEVAFTYGVRMPRETAVAVGELARGLDIRLSVHAPYYVNLAAAEPEKVEASRGRILEAAHRAHLMGAGPVVFHPGFYLGRPEDRVYGLIRDEVLVLQEAVAKAGWRVRLCPETTGKPSQFGSLEEILGLAADTGCGITVDFAHLYARNRGEVDYAGVLSRLPSSFHAHFSGIAYTDKGEKKHLDTTEAFFEPLAEALVRSRARATLVCESPRPLSDAVMMRRVLERLARPHREPEGRAPSVPDPQ